MVNLKVAKEMFDAAKPKLKGDSQMINTFEQTFNLPRYTVPLAGSAELLSATLLTASFASKRASQAGALLAVGVLAVAVERTFKAGGGKAGAQHAIDVAKLAGLSLLDSVLSKK